MFVNSRCLHHNVNSRALRLQLGQLRAVNRAGRREIRRRRAHLREARKLQQDEQWFDHPGPSSSNCSSTSTRVSYSDALLDMLPRNDLLESAVALTISENRDARTELEFVRHFMAGSLLSLASPVGPWDPYDTKPQVFALDKYIALPVFTSVDYLRLFCRRFRFTVRDPSGVLWADGPTEAAEEEQSNGKGGALPRPDVTKSQWWDRHVQHYPSALLPVPATVCEDHQGLFVASAGVAGGKGLAVGIGGERRSLQCMDAEDLFHSVEPEAEVVNRGGRTVGKANRKKNKTVSRVHMYQRKRRLAGKVVPGGEEAPKGRHERNKEALEAFWSKVSRTAPFQIERATPLPTFGPLLHSFFIGYFADTETLLHNASIVPEKVDIVLNPASPIEFVLAREATDRILHKDQLLLLAYRRVERELRGEFHRFFRLYAPEVLWARSACIPTPVSGTNVGARYEVVILFHSSNPDQTYWSLRAAKARYFLMGHADLDVLPWCAAAPYVQEASTIFYERAALTEKDNNSGGAELGVFEQRGPVQTVSIVRPADSYFHDPSAAYTESHAVFTEELKLRRYVC